MISGVNCKTKETSSTIPHVESVNITSTKQIPEEASRIISLLPPINPSVKIIVAIPVYKEFDSGRIAETLNELQKQTLPRSEFETLLVVNNPRPGFDPYGNTGYEENLKLIAHVSGEKERGSLDNIHVIDATDGRISQRHMGLIRGIGNEVAMERLQSTETGNKGVIVQLDADSSTDPDFLEKLLGEYTNDPTLESATIARLPLPMDYQDEMFYLALANSFKKNVEAKYGKGTLSASGATISFRAYLQGVPEFRRYMNASMNEDVHQGEQLPRLSRHSLLPEPRVYAGDRKRKEGFDAVIRSVFSGNPVSISSFQGLIDIIGKTHNLSRVVLDQEKKPDPFSAIQDLLHNNPSLLEKFLEYYKRELELVGRRIDLNKANKENVNMGACLFALSRMALSNRPDMS